MSARRRYSKNISVGASTQRDLRFPVLASAILGLYDVYEPEGVALWLIGRKASLDGKTPLDLIRDGEIDEFVRTVEGLLGGTAT